MSQLYALLTNVKEAITKAIATGKTGMPPSRQRLEYAICPHTIHHDLKQEFTKQNLLQMQTFTKTTPISKGLNRWLMSLVIAVLALTITTTSNAQVTVTGDGAGGSPYANLQAAIAALPATLTQSTVITVDPGNPQSAPVGGYSITTTGTALFSLTITGSGNTVTAPTPQASGSLNDAIFKIIGGDFITIQGFTMAENGANTTTAAGTNNMTEWGVAVLYASTTNGAQNVTIQNNTISLNRTYQNTFGIYSNSTHAAATPTTSATATTAAGTNSGLKVYSNNISNVNHGIIVVGPTAAADANTGVEIGGASLGNTITNYGTTGTFSAYPNLAGTPGVNGILIRNSNGFTVSNNTITSSVGGVTVGTLYAIHIPAASATPTGTFTNNINSNSISLRSGLIAGAMTGINYPSGSANATSTVNINSNDFNTFGHTVAGTAAIIFITSGSTHFSTTINNNTFTNISVNTTGSVTFITSSITTPAGGSQTISNNSIVTAFNKTGAGGTITFISNAGSSTTVTQNWNNNNFSNITVTGATTIAGITNTDGGTVNHNITNNTINNITGGTSPITGINSSFGGGNGGNGNLVSGNTITNITSAGAITGISIGTSGTTSTVTGNTISGLATTGASLVVGITSGAPTSCVISKNTVCNLQSNNAAGTVSGIAVTAGTLHTLSNNRIADLRTPASNLANPLIGINITGGTTVNAYYNTVYLNGTSSGALFGSSAISVSSTPTVTLNNNIFHNASGVTGAGLAAAHRRSTTTLTTYGSGSNRNNFFGTTIFTDGTNTDAAMPAYKVRVASRDANSVSENSSFLSTTCGNSNFLKINTATSTLLESGGSAIGGITDDFEGDIRSLTTPDIGADEFAGTSPAPSVAFNSITPSTTQCVATARLVSVTATTPAGTTITGVTITYNNGTLNSNVAMTNTSGNIWEYSIPAASPTNTTVTWSVTATNSIALTATYVGATYQDDPLFGGVGSATASPATVCSGSTSTLTAVFNVPNQSKTVGTGGSTSASTAASFFPGAWGGAKTQYIIRASELTAAGLGAGNITSLSFETTNSGQTYQGFTVQIGHTAQTDMTTAFIASGLTQVYKGTLTDDGYTPLVGVNALAFGTGTGSLSSFTWDGSSNIVISICWSRVPANTTSTATSMIVVPAGFTSSAYEQSDSETPAAMCAKTVADGTGTNRPKFTFVGNGSLTMASVSWNDGTSNIGTGNPFPVNPTTATTYTPTGTDANGCTLVAATGASVSILALPTAPGVGSFPSFQCGTGVPNEFVSGGLPGQYRWYTFNGTIYTLIPGETGASLVSYSISTTTTLYVAINDGTCESAKTAVVANVVPPDPVTAVATPATVCANVSFDLSITQTGSNQNYSFDWTASPALGSGITGSVAGAPVTGLASITPTAGGNYVYTVTATDGPCLTTGTVNVTVTAPPVINTPTAVPPTICLGQSSVLTATTTTSAPGIATIGTATTLSGTSDNNTAFNNRWPSARFQLLYTAAELQAQGMLAGNITSIAFNIASLGDGATNDNYRVKIGNTALSALTAFVDTATGFTNVYNPKTYTHTISGWQTIPFDAPFNWDGTSNIIVQVVMSGADNLLNSETYYTATTGNQAAYTATASTNAATLSLNRLNIRFGAIVGASGAGTLDWSWNNGGGTGNSVTVSPAGTTLYTVTATDNGTTCSNTATVNVTVLPVPNAPIGTNSQQCGTGIPTLYVASGNGVDSTGIYKWYLVPTNGTAIAGESSWFLQNYSISTPTSFYVSEVGANGCESPRTQVDVTFDLIPDDLTLSASPSPICLGASFTFTVGQTGGSNSFIFDYPTLSHVSGSGINIPIIEGVDSSLLDPNITVTPTVAGTYTYTVKGFDPDKGCVSIATTTVLVNPLPAITGFTVTPSPLCEGAALALKGEIVQSAPGTAAIGTQTTTEFGGGVYRNGAGTGDFRHQLLYTASELSAAGLLAGNLTSLSFNVTSAGSGTANNYTIKLAPTAATALTTTFQTPVFTTCYTATTYVAVAGSNLHTFTTPFAWDGSSNIIVEICYNIGSTGSTSTVAATTPGFIANTNLLATAGACTAATGSTFANRPLATFGGSVGTNFTGNYTWGFNPGAISGGTTGTASTTANTVITAYTVTATTTATGCSVTSAPVNITVNALPAAPTASDVSRCGPGAVSLTATAAGGGTLKWYTVAANGTSVFAGSPYAIANVTANTPYWVSETNTSTGCEGPRTQVNVTLTAAPALSITPGGATTFCFNNGTGSVALNATTVDYINYSWASVPAIGAGISPTNTGAVIATPTVAGVYTITVTANDGDPDGGCSNTASIVVTATANPVIVSATATPTTSCSGGNVVLTATTNAIGAGTAAIGTGTTLTGVTATPTAFLNRWPSYRMQLVFTAAELQAAGLYAGNITSLAFNIATLGSEDFNDDYRIKIGNTALSAFTAFVDTTTGFTDVYYPKTYTHTVGLNTIPFDAPFNWDGTSNIIVQVCMLGADASDNSQTYYTATTGSNTVAYTTTAETQAASLSVNRLNVVFGGSVLSTGAGSLNWVWNPGALPGNSITQNPTSDQSYTVTATDPATTCSTTSAAIPVTILPASTNATASLSAICIGGSSTLSANSTPGLPVTYSWVVDGTTTPVLGTAATLVVSPTAETTYKVTVTDLCNNIATSLVTVTVNPLPTASINEASTSICLPATYGLTSTTNAALPTYQWIKVPSDISGETSSSYTVTTTGFYRVRVTDDATGCSFTSPQITVNVNSLPAPVVMTPTSATVCAGTPQTLNAVSGTSGGGTIGAGTTTNTVSAPYKGFWGGHKAQYLYTAAELATIGFTSGSSVSALAMNVSAYSSPYTFNNFTISMKNTIATVLTTTPESGTSTVFGPINYTLTGTAPFTVSHTLTTPFAWDGTSNLLVEFCFNNVNGGGVSANSATVTSTTTATALATYFSADNNANVCTTTSGWTTSTNRPNMNLSFNTASPITWSPSTGLNTTSGNTVIATPATTTTYTATATTPAGCTLDNTVELTVNPVTVITVDAAPATQLVGQNTTATPLTATATGTGTVTYSWYSNAANSSIGGTLVSGPNPTGTYAPSTAATGIVYYYAVASGDCGLDTTSVVSVEVVNANTNFWTGNAGSNWSTPGSWSLSAVPTTLNDAIIPTGATPYPVLSAASTAKNLDIQSGATVSLNGQTLTITEAISGTGTFIGSAASNLAVGATSTLRFAAGAGGVVKNLTINGASTTATLATALDITGGTGTANTHGTVTVASGAVLASGGLLTFKSTASGTARLASGNVTGDVTVERYIPGGPGATPAYQRAWRMLSVPTKGSQKIKQAWQEGATANNFNPKPGFGTVITNKTTPYATLIANGFDEYTAKASMQSWNSTTSAWVDVAATTGAGSIGNIENNRGYAIYIRGDRTQTAAGAVTATTPTTLRTTGTLYIGNQAPIAVGPNKFDMIGNVFVSAIDFTGLTKVGMNNVYYVWDPRLPSTTGSLGGYVSFTGTNGWLPVPATGSYTTANTVLESGQAFFVVAGAAGGTVALPESAKVSTSRSTVFRPVAPSVSTVQSDTLVANLFTVEADGTSGMADANVTVFDNSYSNAVDGDDAPKLFSSGENFAIRRGNKILVVEGRQPTTERDTTYFFITNFRQAQQYKLELITKNMSVPGRKAYLIDNFLTDTVALDLITTFDTTYYSFTLTADPASAGSDRFKIVFSQQFSTVPVTFVSISANKVGSGIKVDWKVAAESGIRQYEIQRSVNGRDFVSVGSSAALANDGSEHSYSFMDATPLSGSNFYRIKSTSIAGVIKYTNIAKVLLGDLKSGFTIAPNPVEGSLLNLQFKNKAEGRYVIRLLSNSGQAMFTSNIQHAGGNSTQFINLPVTIARGSYQLEIIAPDKARTVENLFINTLK